MTTIPISGLSHTACILDSSWFIRPLLGLHVEVTFNRLVRLQVRRDL